MEDLHDRESTETWRLKVTWRLAEKLLGRNTEDFRANTTFSNRNTKWWEASFYRIEHDVPVFIPTNLPRVSYLDLAQHFHSFPKQTRKLIDLVTLAHESLRKIKQNPLVDPIPRPWDVRRLEKTLDYMVEAHHGLVKYTLDIEYHDHVYKSLKVHWDASRFKRFSDYFLRMDQTFIGPEIPMKAEMIVNLLVMHSVDDSSMVVQVFNEICWRYQVQDMEEFPLYLDTLPSNLLKYYGNHLKRVPFIDVFEDWFYVEDPVINAIIDGDSWKVKRFVEYEFPSTMLPFVMTPPVAKMMNGTWPRKKNGLEIRSYNSLEYFSLFTIFLAECLLRVNQRQSSFAFSRLRTGFRTFWQAVPTPHLPFTDMSACLHRMFDTYPERLAFMDVEFGGIEGKKLLVKLLEKLLTDEEEYCQDVYAPRSLQHLCRFAIRCLCPTAEEIATLPVADKMKPYLSLDNPPRLWAPPFLSPPESADSSGDSSDYSGDSSDYSGDSSDSSGDSDDTS